MSTDPVRDESVDLIHVELTRSEAQGLRMACRWGCPDPMPREIASAVRKLGEAEADATGGRLSSPRSTVRLPNPDDL